MERGGREGDKRGDERGDERKVTDVQVIATVRRTALETIFTRKKSWRRRGLGPIEKEWRNA